MKIDKEKLDLIMARKCINRICLAQNAGISYQTIQRSTGNRGVKADTVGKIAAALGVDPSELLCNL